MFDSHSFDYINILDKAADASWLRNEAIVNNIANKSTPGYKRQDVAFENILSQKLGAAAFQNMDDKVAKVDFNQLAPKVYTDKSSLSYNLDGNNVDIDTENVQLAYNKIRYDQLINSMSAEFKRIQAVLK